MLYCMSYAVCLLMLHGLQARASSWLGLHVPLLVCLARDVRRRLRSKSKVYSLKFQSKVKSH